VVITVSNLYGSGAIAIAHLVAERLGYEYVDEQLPVVVAKRLQTSPSAVESAENTGKSMSERMLQALESGTPELRGQSGATFDEECLREVQETVREYAAHGNAVIIGRGANAILGRRPDVLRVFMYAPRDWRVRHIMESHSVDEKTAAAEVDRIDRARTEYMRTYYGVTWNSPENYDLCLDTSDFGAEGCAQIIISAVEAR
jgi:cytidylate kinase